jgi:hypothetical protein
VSVDGRVTADVQDVKAAPDSSTPQHIRTLEVQADAYLMVDDLKTAAEICRQIVKLVSPSSEMGQFYSDRLNTLEQALTNQAGSP